MTDLLQDLGFNDFFQREVTKFKEYDVGRVYSLSKGIYKLITSKGELNAVVSGKFRYTVTGASDYPTVGDFVMFTETDGNSLIHQVLPRKSLIIRKEAGMTHETQLIAANVDKIFICMSLNNDFNIRRLERYLSIAWDSGAIPIIVLTKADLCQNIEEMLEKITQISMGVDVLVTSYINSEGAEELKNTLWNGQTVAFIGSSGVGKSTLINSLLGEDYIKTRDIRSDGKGKHATTRRELFLVPGHGVVIDTPGMRELGVQSIDLSRSFADIEELAMKCKFNDCQHNSEPGCEVKRAISQGEISNSRLQSFRKLKREVRHEELKVADRKERIRSRNENLQETKRIRKAMKARNRKKL
ncbi:ribosome small subunit-dependent GTPase A [Gracilibacillus sp. S3-1-1]|uniref:Ribosome small subunit-dependent GTPase A n=1 Tax=Gracilibacillus pellucidus TaxID=3095368 RepID=A0ACC6M5T9_9BACI|nr:ribosome small subunit-dependent GTPase A [Gracilibacillus sp. S3-1-1]MDX8046283.1 ribosome small subunit-dependent GTPase A [Gracilibacillus sp. S3-1-1]